nr:keratin, type II cytoskeletal 1-like [Procambarus clarkii]
MKEAQKWAISRGESETGSDLSEGEYTSKCDAVLEGRVAVTLMHQPTARVGSSHGHRNKSLDFENCGNSVGSGRPRWDRRQVEPPELLNGGTRLVYLLVQVVRNGSGKYGNGGSGKYGNVGSGKYGNGGSGKYGKGGSEKQGKYGNGGSGRYGNGGSRKYGNGGSGKYGNGGSRKYGNGGSGKYDAIDAHNGVFNCYFTDSR